MKPQNIDLSQPVSGTFLSHFVVGPQVKEAASTESIPSSITAPHAVQ
jgi:hypothetical protein